MWLAPDDFDELQKKLQNCGEDLRLDSINEARDRLCGPNILTSPKLHARGEEVDSEQYHTISEGCDVEQTQTEKISGKDAGLQAPELSYKSLPDDSDGSLNPVLSYRCNMPQQTGQSTGKIPRLPSDVVSVPHA